MNISGLSVASAVNAQVQTQQIMAVSMVKMAVAQEKAMVGMLDQAMNMVKSQNAPAPAGMGANVDKMA